MNIPTLLLVDDDITNLYVLEKYLEDEDYPGYQAYELVKASNGNEALALLESEPERFDAVLLDIMMPEIDGLEVLRRMKSNEALSSLPVILQTAKAREEEIEAGLKAGAFYYLTKPIKQKQLLPVIKTAVDNNARYKMLKSEIKKLAKTVAITKKWSLEIQSLEEVENATTLLANMYPDPEKMVIGLSELLLNAIEHGNLGISYDEKTELIDECSWEAEVEHRLSLPENCDKRALIEIENVGSEIRLLIKDQGTGFDWHAYLEIDTERVMDNHGRGIAMARQMSFDSIEYHGTGSEVVALKKL